MKTRHLIPSDVRRLGVLAGLTEPTVRRWLSGLPVQPGSQRALESAATRLGWQVGSLAGGLTIVADSTAERPTPTGPTLLERMPEIA